MNQKIVFRLGSITAISTRLPKSKKWKFEDKESALRFTIAVLKQSTKDSLAFRQGDELLEKSWQAGGSGHKLNRNFTETELHDRPQL